MYIKVKFKDLTVLNTRILHLLMPFKPFYNIYQQNKFDNKHQKKTNQSNQNKSKTKEQKKKKIKEPKKKEKKKKKKPPAKASGLSNIA